MKCIKDFSLLFVILLCGNTFAKSASLLSLEFNYNKTSTLLHPPYISSVINDTTDPAFSCGFFVSVSYNGKPILPNDYIVKIENDNPLVVANNGIIITKNNGDFNVKIKPSSVGYANITLSVIKGKDKEEMIVYYAASSSNKSLQTITHTGFSDASAAINIDEQYMIVGDDESNSLVVYDKTQSGLPVNIFNYEKYLNSGEASSKEIDCEAGVRSLKSKNIIYWTGSMGNGGKKYEEKPTRSTLIATEFKGTGKNTKFNFKDSYTELRKKLIEWGDKNGYNFSASAANGEKPKQINGFNIEGMVFAPDSSTLYIAFRAPLVPATSRTKAVIAPIKKFEEWFSNGHYSKKINIDTPIELNLDGRGFRDIIKLSNAMYLIVAGNSNAERNAALYLWSGYASDVPKLVSNKDIKDFNIEAAVELTNDGNYTGKVQLLCDDGATSFYDDNIHSKYLNNGFKKFRSLIVTLR